MKLLGLRGLYMTTCCQKPKVSGVSVQISAQPPPKKTAGQIEKETGTSII